MFQRRSKRFRRRSNGRNHMQRGNGDLHRIRINSFSNGQRNNFRSTQSAEKLFEKYNALAKEALSSGDKTLSENYLQHADHYMRIIDDKNRNQNQPKTNFIHKTTEENKNLSQSKDANQGQVSENNDTNQGPVGENKE